MKECLTVKRQGCVLWVKYSAPDNVDKGKRRYINLCMRDKAIFKPDLYGWLNLKSIKYVQKYMGVIPNSNDLIRVSKN